MRAINMPNFHIPILDGFFMISIIAAFVAILMEKRLVTIKCSWPRSLRIKICPRGPGSSSDALPSGDPDYCENRYIFEE